MSEARTIFSLSLRDEATGKLKQFTGNYEQTMGKLAEIGDGGGGDNYAQLAVDVTSLEGVMTMLGATAPQVALAMGALNGAVAIMDWGRQSAKILSVRDSYADLAGNAKISSQAMLASMRELSNGTVADTDLMLAANRALVLGVVNSADEMGRLVQAAIVKGRSVGVDATQAVNDLITGIGRMSPEILDNLGIANAKGAFDEYARALGTTADKLTDVQKKQALVNSVLASTQGMTVIDDATTKFQQMDASIKNMKDNLGIAFAPVIAIVADKIAQMAHAIIVATSEVSTFDAMIFDVQEKARLWRGIEFQANTAGMPDPVALQQVARYNALDAALQLVNKALAQGVPQALAWQENLTALATTALKSGQVTDAQAEAINHLIAVMRATTSGAGEMTGAVNTTTQAVKQMAPELIDAANKLGAIGQMALIAASDINTFNAAVGRIQGAMPAIQASTAVKNAGISEIQSLGERAVAAGMDPEQVTALVANATDAVWNLGLSFDNTTEAQFRNKLMVDQSIDPLRDMVTGLEDANRAAQNLGEQGLSDAKKALEDFKSAVSSTVSSQLTQSLSLEPVGVNPDDYLPREDAVQEDAFRLASVMVEGWNSKWVGYFRDEFPQLFADITKGGDIQAGAAGVLKQFQLGMRPELLDFDQLKQQVKDKLAADQVFAGMRDELTAQIMAEMGGSAGEVQGAIDSVMGGLGVGGTAVTAPDLTATGTEAGGSFATGFAVGLQVDGLLIGLASQISAQLATDDTKRALKDSAQAVAIFWGQQLTDKVATDTPAQLLAILTTQLLPLITDALAVQQSQQGAR